MNETKDFKFIQLSASDNLVLGEQYGEQAKEEIALCIEMYKEHLALLRGFDWRFAREEAMSYLQLVSAALPLETAILRGTAAGAGVDFADIMVLNTRYEMLHYPKKECTTFAVLKEASADNKVYVGQNWDQRPAVIPHSLILHLTLNDGSKIMGMTEAGQLPRNGVNSNGLGLTASGLESSLDARRIGIPGNFSRMRALRSSSFGEMSEVLTAFDRSVANNYCIASAEGVAADIEGIPGQPYVLLPEKGVITHANHILSRPELDASKGKKFRSERLRELLLARTGDITLSYIKECLADHDGYPDSVCSHTDEGSHDRHRQWMTVASMIYDLTEPALHVCYGNPCEGSYKTLRLMDY